MDNNLHLGVKASVIVNNRARQPGELSLSPDSHHRILLHSSPVTRTFCQETGTMFDRRSGDVDIIPAGKPGGYRAETAFRTIEVLLAPALLEDSVREHPSAGQGYHLDTRHLLRDERIQYLVRTLDIEREAGFPSGRMFAETIGAALSLRLMAVRDDDREAMAGLSRIQMRRVDDYIRGHLDQAIGIEALSRAVGVSSSHLRKWFKVETGLTLHRFILSRRLERARELLIQGKLSIGEIAELTGFAHQSHLAYWIGREYGHSPRELRRLHLPKGPKLTGSK